MLNLRLDCLLGRGLMARWVAFAIRLCSLPSARGHPVFHVCLFSLLSSAGASPVPAANLPSLCDDRVAIERVHYRQRLGNKLPFEALLPPVAVSNLVRQDLRKEAVMMKVYGAPIPDSMIDAEVRRIHQTTRAPQVLAEIKNALGNDPVRFARSFAKPIVVERQLRMRFENDARLHAPQRQMVEDARAELLALRKNGADWKVQLTRLKRGRSDVVTEYDWQLSARPEDRASRPTVDEVRVKSQFGPGAQILSAPPSAGLGQAYFEDLPDELQNVLRAQLRASGDVSAVIETPTGFLFYLVKDRSAEVLSVAQMSIAKRSYEGWIEEMAADW